MDPARPVVRELKDVGKSGSLELVFGRKEGKTIIRHAYSEVPHKITHLYHPPHSTLAELILMNTTAGLFGGDRVDVRIHAETGARILLTSQSSLKVHPGVGTAEQVLRLTVDTGAELHYYNDPLIPFKGARLRQRIELQIASGSRFFYWDGFMAGRVARGETWEFDEIDAETRLSRDGELVYLERYRMAGDRHPFSYAATGIFVPAPEALSACHGPQVGIDSPVPGITIVRAVANTGTEYRDIRTKISQVFPTFLSRGGA